MEKARDSAQNSQYNIKPKGIIDLALLHVNGQRWNEKANNYLQNLVIHQTLSF